MLVKNFIKIANIIFLDLIKGVNFMQPLMSYFFLYSGKCKYQLLD